MKTLVVAAFLVLAASAPQDPQPPKPTAQHQWLQQLVGEWTFASEASMGPGQDAITMKGTESVSAIGGMWVVLQGTGVLMGEKMQSMMTLGYDPEDKAFVGTWVDSMQPRMWRYRGTLDDGKKVLTLATEGPAFDDPTRTAQFRDTIELVDADTRLLYSQIQGTDGKWTEFMRAKYTRKR
ncbi:MAG: DUF1579 domain-containing protein [Planctomycetota bacterium]